MVDSGVGAGLALLALLLLLAARGAFDAALLFRAHGDRDFAHAAFGHGEADLFHFGEDIWAEFALEIVGEFLHHLARELDGAADGPALRLGGDGLLLRLRLRCRLESLRDGLQLVLRYWLLRCDLHGRDVMDGRGGDGGLRRLLL